jgi:hypothetical protein
MVRLLRRVVRLGLLAGIGVGILKVVRGRKAPDPWADSWVSTGPPGGTRPSAAPVAAAPKPPAPATTATASLAAPPPASPPPPAPASSASATLATPPPASPEPPAPAEAAMSDADDSDAGTSEADKSDAGKATPTRAAKPTRKGPARKSPTGRAEEPPGERLWVPANDGVCPQTHPVKAKLSSKIFHTPSGRNYSRTKADRCYPDEASAQADGLRPALR